MPIDSLFLFLEYGRPIIDPSDYWSLTLAACSKCTLLSGHLVHNVGVQTSVSIVVTTGDAYH